jgi:hypothetical protein
MSHSKRMAVLAHPMTNPWASEARSQNTHPLASMSLC